MLMMRVELHGSGARQRRRIGVEGRVRVLEWTTGDKMIVGIVKCVSEYRFSTMVGIFISIYFEIDVIDDLIDLKID